MKKNTENKYPKPQLSPHNLQKMFLYMFFWKIPNIPMTDPPKFSEIVALFFGFPAQNASPRYDTKSTCWPRPKSSPRFSGHWHETSHSSSGPVLCSSPETIQKSNHLPAELPVSGSALISEAATKFAALRERPTRKMQREKGAATEGAECCI